MQRTFPAPYVDARVKRPDFPLAEALAWYMADKPSLADLLNQPAAAQGD